MAGLSEHTPVYLSPRSADVVLSEIRPTKLAPEALRSVNVLLDELLWMILSMARSFATDQLKAALSKLLPSSLGKEALLEAEVELRAYWDRTTGGAPSQRYTENTQEFPIQPSFELLRLKCEAYSTFNDTDDDVEAEKRWQSKVTGISGFPMHNVQFIPPAALYLTAIIEHVCEHVLSNTGRVASRDSSRSTATLQDLFIALCEDDAIYGLFRIMKVHNQIETQCNAMANKSNRNNMAMHRSVSDNPKGHSLSSSGSPFGSSSTFNGDATQIGSKPRVSSDSTGSGTAVGATGSRSSTDKSKAKKLFGRISVDKEGGSQNGHNSYEGGHKRTASLISTGRRMSSALDDGPGSSPHEVEFDELMRSGTTMKVSLTPDRLRTFDVYSKEKGRGGISKIVIPPADQQAVNRVPLQDSNTVNSPAETANGQAMKNGTSQPQRPDIQVQEMNGEGNDISTTRKPSKGGPPVSYELPPHSRSRSTSASQASIQSVANRHAMSRKGSVGGVPVESLHSQSLRGATPTMQPPKSSGSMASTGGRKTQQSISHDSIDDILNGSSDEDTPLKKPMGRRRAPTVGVTPQTADLIDFLNSGPPDLPKMMSASPTTTSPVDKQMKRGRLRSIVSRLKGGQSMDKLSSQASFEDFQASKRSQAQVNPPPSFIPPPLSAKRSLHSLSSYNQSQLSLPKAPAPPLPTVTAPISPPLSPNHSFADSISMASTRPRNSPTGLRKAVPSFTEPEISAIENGPPSPNPPKSVNTSPPTPSKFEVESPFVQAQQAKPVEDAAGSPKPNGSPKLNGTPAPSVNKTSNTLRTPPPSFPAIRPSSKQSQRHAMSPPSTPKVFATYATDMRRLMANATSADECRLLVDMFLAQSGLPMKESDFPPDPTIAPSAHHESAVVEALLSNGDVLQKSEAQVAKGSVTREQGALPSPRSDEHHSSSTLYRRQAHDVHAAQVVSAEA